MHRLTLVSLATGLLLAVNLPLQAADPATNPPPASTGNNQLMPLNPPSTPGTQPNVQSTQPNTQGTPPKTEAHQNSTVKQFGAIELSGINVNNLDHEGMLRLGNAIVTQLLQVNGIADIENSKLNNVLINGSGTFENSTIQGSVTINGQMDAKSTTFENDVVVEGYLSAQKSQFNKVLTLQGVNTNFTDTTLQDIVIKSSGDANLTPQLILIGSKITGNVTFTGGNGIVTLDSNSVVSGKVEGGTVQKAQ